MTYPGEGMASFLWVTYPNKQKWRMVSFLWVTYPEKCGLIMMVTYPSRTRKSGLILWVTYPIKKNLKVISTASFGVDENF